MTFVKTIIIIHNRWIICNGLLNIGLLFEWFSSTRTTVASTNIKTAQIFTIFVILSMGYFFLLWFFTFGTCISFRLRIIWLISKMSCIYSFVRFNCLNPFRNNWKTNWIFTINVHKIAHSNRMHTAHTTETLHVCIYIYIFDWCAKQMSIF